MTGYYIGWEGADGTRTQCYWAFSRDAARVLLNALNEGVGPGHVVFGEEKAAAWLSGEWSPSDRAYVAWVTSDGQRDAALRTLSEDRAQYIVNRLNTYLCDVAEYFAIPEAKIDSWKDGTWTP